MKVILIENLSIQFKFNAKHFQKKKTIDVEFKYRIKIV